MSKILKSVTLGDVKNGGTFRALGKEFVKLDADEHGCLVLAKDIWTRMPFRDGDDPECPNDLRRSEIMPYLGNCLAEFTKNGTPLSTFIPLRIDLQDTTGQNEYGIFEVRIGLLTLRGYGKYWRLIPKVDAPWWLATPYGRRIALRAPTLTSASGASTPMAPAAATGTAAPMVFAPFCAFPLHSWSLSRTKERPGFRFPMFRWMTCWPKSRAGRRANHGCGKK